MSTPAALGQAVDAGEAAVRVRATTTAAPWRSSGSMTPACTRLVRDTMTARQYVERPLRFGAAGDRRGTARATTPATRTGSCGMAGS
ncbi:MAG: hypothetical protein MZV64_13795 [Ignavibacteriales bacterium]|nr:hypothetical protein [Ignavibacteriales bacterium]